MKMLMFIAFLTCSAIPAFCKETSAGSSADTARIIRQKTPVNIKLTKPLKTVVPVSKPAEKEAADETPSPSTVIYGNPVTDINGNVYPTVLIGGQTWMAENLRVTHFPDGSPILEGIYSNPGAPDSLRGKYYSWFSALGFKSTNGACYNPPCQGICPAGYHIPSKVEWDTLIRYLGGSINAAPQLVPSGSAIWTGGGNPTNTTGFSAFPSGYYSPSDNTIHNFGSRSHIWTVKDAGYAGNFAKTAEIYTSNIFITEDLKTNGCSVRCIKTEP